MSVGDFRRMAAVLPLLLVAAGCAGGHPEGVAARTEAHQQRPAPLAQHGLTDTASQSEKARLAGGALRYRNLTDGYQASFYTPAMTAPRGGHWSFGAGNAEALRVYLHLTGPIVDATVLGRTELADTAVTIYAMPAGQPGFYAGHVIAAWVLGRTTYHLTIHGLRNRSRLTVMAEAMITEIKTCRAGAALTSPSCRLVFKP